MQITISLDDYLSEKEKKEIAVQEFRRAIMQQINSDDKITNILANAAYISVFKETNELVKDAKERIFNKVNEILEDSSNYLVFRNNYLTNAPESLASKMLEEAVRNNKELLNQKVHDVIAQCDDERIWNLFEDLAGSFESIICQIAKTARENARLKSNDQD